MADDKDKNAQQAPAVDNTSPEEKALADKLMAELMASGVDVNALAAKDSAPAPAVTPAPATPPPKPAAPAPTPAPAPMPPPPAKPDAPSPSPSTSSGPAASTSSGPTAPPPKPVEAPPAVALAPVAPPPAASTSPGPAAPIPTSTQDVESFIESLDSTLARLNDSQFFVIRISKPVFYILTGLIALLLIIVPRLPR